MSQSDVAIIVGAGQGLSAALARLLSAPFRAGFSPSRPGAPGAADRPEAHHVASAVAG